MEDIKNKYIAQPLKVLQIHKILKKITQNYEKELIETYELINETLNFLKSKANNIGRKPLILFNMAAVYLIILFEGFNKQFFKAAANFVYYEDEISFEKKYNKSYKLKEEIIEGAFGIDLKREFKQWEHIEKLHEARNQVTHNIKDIPEHSIIEISYHAVKEYFQFIQEKVIAFIETTKE